MLAGQPAIHKEHSGALCSLWSSVSGAPLSSCVLLACFAQHCILSVSFAVCPKEHSVCLDATVVGERYRSMHYISHEYTQLRPYHTASHCTLASGVLHMPLAHSFLCCASIGQRRSTKCRLTKQDSGQPVTISPWAPLSQGRIRIWCWLVCKYGTPKE